MTHVRTEASTRKRSGPEPCSAAEGPADGGVDVVEDVRPHGSGAQLLVTIAIIIIFVDVIAAAVAAAGRSVDMPAPARNAAHAPRLVGIHVVNQMARSDRPAAGGPAGLARGLALALALALALGRVLECLRLPLHALADGRLLLSQRQPTLTRPA